MNAGGARGERGKKGKRNPGCGQIENRLYTCVCARARAGIMVFVEIVRNGNSARTRMGTRRNKKNKGEEAVERERVCLSG